MIASFPRNLEDEVIGREVRRAEVSGELADDGDEGVFEEGELGGYAGAVEGCEVGVGPTRGGFGMLGMVLTRDALQKGAGGNDWVTRGKKRDEKQEDGGKQNGGPTYATQPDAPPPPSSSPAPDSPPQVYSPNYPH